MEEKKKKGVWEHLFLATLSVSCESDGQLKWVGLGQVRNFAHLGSRKGILSDIRMYCSIQKVMRGRTEMSCEREAHDETEEA